MKNQSSIENSSNARKSDERKAVEPIRWSKLSNHQEEPMKAGPKMFEAVAELIRKGLSPSRAAKSLRLSPDTVSRWRRECPEFALLVDEAESSFVERMTTCIAEAAPSDWRAAEALLARRFPTEFARDNAALQFALSVNTEPTQSLDDVLASLRNSPTAMKMCEASEILNSALGSVAKNSEIG